MTTPLLEARSLHKWFPLDRTKVPLLKGIDLVLEENSSYALMGRSGAGKTTLLHILATLEPFSEGTLLYEGKDIASFCPEKLRNTSFGFVFQSFYLLEDLPVIDNVLLPFRLSRQSCMTSEQASERAYQLLLRCSLFDKRHVKACHLSGGEKQRVSIARALLLKPKLLFLDEPTGSLDKENEQLVMDLIFQQAKEEQTTLLLVTHNEKLARRADHLLLLEEGKVSASH